MAWNILPTDCQGEEEEGLLSQQARIRRHASNVVNNSTDDDDDDDEKEEDAKRGSKLRRQVVHLRRKVRKLRKELRQLRKLKPVEDDADGAAACVDHAGVVRRAGDKWSVVDQTKEGDCAHCTCTVRSGLLNNAVTVYLTAITSLYRVKAYDAKSTIVSGPSS
jgi:hypothetical protein